MKLEIHQDSFLKQKGEPFTKGKKCCVLCECLLCGRETTPEVASVINGRVKSCGCLKQIKPKNDYTGQITESGIMFLGYVGSSVWRLKYACGHIADVKTRDSIFKSTGLCRNCSRAETCVKRNTSHGMSHTPEYSSWLNMKRRCYETSHNRFDNYGGKGISVCERWLECFENFYADMGSCPEGHSLERLNLELGYEAENCVWADDITQANNKTNVRLIQNNGEVWSLMRWCKLLGINYKSAWYKVNAKGLDITLVLGQNFSYVDI